MSGCAAHVQHADMAASGIPSGQGWLAHSRSRDRSPSVTLACLALVACTYQPGSFRYFSGKRVTLGCVDLAVARVTREDARGPTVQYTFGNRCTERVGLDLATVRANSQGVALAPYDPRGELRPLSLVASWSGLERIEYRGVPPDAPVCVDVGGVDRSVTPTEKWICL